MANLTVDALFEKVGRLYMEVAALNLELVALKQQNGELSRAAGEALRALEEFGHKEVANLILKGRPWHVALAPAEAAEIAEG